MIAYDLIATQPHNKGKIKYHGGGKYAEIVFCRMIQLNKKFIAFYDSSNWISPDLLEVANDNGITLYDIQKDSLDSICSKYNNICIFSILPQKSYLKYKTIGVIHDFRSLHAPIDNMMFRLRFKLTDIKRYILYRFCGKMLTKRVTLAMRNLLMHNNFYPTTITYFTKSILQLHYYNEKVKRIPIFYTPSYYDLYEDYNSLSDEHFLLLVSGDRAIKNPVRAILAMDMIFDIPEYKKYKLVITGLESLSDVKIRIRNKDNFICKGYVDESNLCSLYKNCTALLFPSLYEGFGMPPLEAMSYGKPVLSSNLTAMPEVLGDAAIYFDAYSVYDIASKVLLLLSDSAIYNRYKTLSVNRFKLIFSQQKEELDAFINYAFSIVNKES